MKQLGALAVGLWLSMVGSIGWALELGPAQVQSRLEAPLQAMVPLVDGDAYSPSAIEVSVAGEDAFADAGVEWTPMAGRVQAVIQERQGQPVVVLTSNQPITSPWLDLLLTVDSPGGRQSQAITLLFDPADYGAADRPAASVAPQPAAENPAAGNDAPAVPQNRKAAQGDAYVRSGDTLWSVAARTKPEQASVQQMMLALLEANPSAFPSGNIHEMRAAQRLTLPDESRVMARSAEQAAETIRAMNAAWQRRDENGPAPVALPEIEAVADDATSDAPSPQVEQSAPGVDAAALSAAQALGRAPRATPDAAASTLETATAAPVDASSPAPAMGAALSLQRQQELDEMRGELAALREEVTRLSDALAAQSVPSRAPVENQGRSLIERLSDYQWWLLVIALVLLLGLLLVMRRRRQQWEAPPAMAAAGGDNAYASSPSAAGPSRVTPSMPPEPPSQVPHSQPPPVMAEAVEEPVTSETFQEPPSRDENLSSTAYEAPLDRAAMAHTQAAGLIEIGQERRLALQAYTAEHDPSLWLAPPAKPQAVAAMLSAMGARGQEDATVQGPEQPSPAKAAPGPEEEQAWMIDYQPPMLASGSTAREETPMQPTVEFDAQAPASPAPPPVADPEEEWEIEEVAFAPAPRDNGAPSTPGNVDKKR
ncbi:FimV/HubP family polar landmark protein [Vreelandella gomseomensis]|uniref:FimV/HubP family polar landmark protein n=1 Tax=Vreelandella gomseomensis TaxID=370766 RepID=A0ABU1GAM9_9GAMM|nr:FimV/HubP family polar landmark protein [Halomonas gomseomensis]MDR5874518.1 FimV/HubP family polar landmark protein [Halomonas gomseomensis]